MDELSLKIEYVPIDSIKPYSRNAKLHPQEQIEQIKESIRQVGFRDPIGIWHGEIVEGHGRHIAAKELGMETVPVIRLDDMTDEERRAYMLIHNQTTMNSGFDQTLLDIELGDITGIDMTAFGFSMPLMMDEIEGGEIEDNTENPVAVKIVFESAEKWRHFEQQVRDLVDTMDGVNVSVGSYENQ